MRKIKNGRNINMKNLSRRDFLRLSGAAVFAVGMTGALSGCDSSHVVTASKLVDFNEEVKTSVGTIKFTKCYRVFHAADTVNNYPDRWFVACYAEITAAKGYTLELDKDSLWIEVDGKKPEKMGISRADSVLSGTKVTVGEEKVTVIIDTEVIGGSDAGPEKLMGVLNYKGVSVKTKVQDLKDLTLT